MTVHVTFACVLCSPQEEAMESAYYVAGIDVHKKMLTASKVVCLQQRHLFAGAAKSPA